MKSPRPSYFLTVLSNKCPRCREGHIFKSTNAYALKNNVYREMHEHCPSCGQLIDLEIGFYYGTGYVSYFVTVLITMITFFIWWPLFGISIYDNRIFYWLGINSVLLVILQPPIIRWSRTLWLSWFVKYDPNWKTNPYVHPDMME